jgi:hypothetical protein
MRLFEKTIELTLCSQFSWLLHPWPWQPFPFGMRQPFWFGLTQKQEARAGFDAATQLNGGRLLILQFKAGRRLRNGNIRFHAPHVQLTALQQRVRTQHRLVYYVLPQATQTSDIQGPDWLIQQTWFLDVASIPPLSTPGRSSGAHHMTLDTLSGKVVITSDPVEVQAVDWRYIAANSSPLALGASFENFDKFWSYVSSVGRGGVAFAPPRA